MAVVEGGGRFDYGGGGSLVVGQLSVVPVEAGHAVGAREQVDVGLARYDVAHIGGDVQRVARQVERHL